MDLTELIDAIGTLPPGTPSIQITIKGRYGSQLSLSVPEETELPSLWRRIPESQVQRLPGWKRVLYTGDV